MSEIVEEEYEMLEIPGLDHNIQIAVLPSMRYNDMESDGNVRYHEWIVAIGAMFLPELGIPLYGWYAESERYTGTDVSNQLFTAGKLRHSELIIIIPNGQHLASLDNYLANGESISHVIITRLITLNGRRLPIQVNEFGNCYVIHVQQIHDKLLVRMRINSKTVVCTSYSQKGRILGVSMYDINFSTCGSYKEDAKNAVKNKVLNNKVVKKFFK